MKKIVVLFAMFGLSLLSAEVTQDDANAAKQAYEDIRQNYSNISRNARVMQEVNTTMWKYIRELEEQNTALKEEVGQYRNIFRNINNDINRINNQANSVN